MDAESYMPLVTELFPTAQGRGRSTGVAIEHELVTTWVAGGSAVPVERLRAVVCNAAYAPYVSFEPGGQIELSLPRAASAAATVRAARAHLRALRADCARAGIAVHAWSVDPRPESAVPLQLTSPRYVAMQRHFDAIGPAGRVMMRRTCSTQVCLDWWSGPASLEQWRALNLAAPFLAAAFARATGPDSRLATWLQVDPARTAFDGRLLAGEDPVAAYSAFAAGAARFVAQGREHLTTLFAPVRPRGRYLEVRFPDVQEDAAIGAVVHTLAAIAHDDDVRRAVLARLAGEAPYLDQHWYDAAHGRGEVAAHGQELVAMATRRGLVAA